MKQFKINVLLTLVLCFSTVSAETNLMSWLRGLDQSTEPIQDTNCCMQVYRSLFSNRAMVSVANDGRRYAVLSCSDEAQFVEIRSFYDDSTVLVYTNGTLNENCFAPIDLLWSPDSEQLLIKFGYKDTGVGFWFPHDSFTGKILENQDRLEQLAATTIEQRQRTRSLHYDSPNPVWTQGGKRFSSDYSARKAGYHVLYGPPLLRRRPENVVRVDWPDGKKYKLFMESGLRGWFANVVEGGKLVDRVEAESPIYKRTLFVYENDNLVAKILPQQNSLEGAVTVNFGNRKLERVTNLGKVGLLVRSRDDSYLYWQLLNPHKIRYLPKQPDVKK